MDSIGDVSTVQPGPLGSRPSRAATGAVLLAELTKIRTVRSTIWTLLLTFGVSVGLSLLVGLSFANQPPEQQRTAVDPLFAAFYSLTLGQLALVVFGVLVLGSEYSSGTIRATLVAVPRRGLGYLGKVLATGLLALAVAVPTVLASFFTAQAALGRYGVSLGSDGALAAVVGACLHLTLLCLFALGVTTMLRGSVRSLGVLLPLFFLGSQGLGNIPKVRTVTQFLPDQTGWVIMHLAGPQDEARWVRDYGPWTGIGILVLWTAAALLGGYLMLRRRDA
ncbi:ABC-2 transporter permease [Plantactinospora soyae]|uniref:ABC-type transport system involved in multi-copper enzyme maturation permease subunit n=1 Tax=Plantactinospora soyae TaxID=1544732 RepID=A0A927R202_9ACTN|nr:ABC transporter permease subunit [Plantactinospora soyae]MBE1490258.1 ABC-type transport system involved in multi-copper enzyme maturation permease subunit [Plantactinospora soyae]